MLYNPSVPSICPHVRSMADNFENSEIGNLGWVIIIKGLIIEGWVLKRKQKYCFNLFVLPGQKKVYEIFKICCFS